MDCRPGLNPRRLVALMERAIERCALRLDGSIVLTEAATGAYAVTPILAAMAGAQVYARARATRYGSVAEVFDLARLLAGLAGVRNRIALSAGIPDEAVRQADIVTNSGHLRPIDAAMIARMKPTAVIPLMYESWELRAEDLDIAACARRGIPVGGTNERHPAIAVFPFLGSMAVKLLLDAGIEAHSSRVLLLCDNDFSSYIESGLRAAGADLQVSAELPGSPPKPGYDAVLVALRPRSEPVLGAGAAPQLAAWNPPPVVLQYWGDLDRTAFDAMRIPLWPLEAPAPGHMGVLPSDVGPGPIVRLQTGGLKVGEVLWRARTAGKTCDESLRALAASQFGTAL